MRPWILYPKKNGWLRVPKNPRAWNDVKLQLHEVARLVGQKTLPVTTSPYIQTKLQATSGHISEQRNIPSIIAKEELQLAELLSKQYSSDASRAGAAEKDGPEHPLLQPLNLHQESKGRHIYIQTPTDGPSGLWMIWLVVSQTSTMFSQMDGSQVWNHPAVLQCKGNQAIWLVRILWLNATNVPATSHCLLWYQHRYTVISMEFQTS